ncbi:MAG: non-canonical purine NTP pyrophosphatase [Candidatus Nealsonbacteria bacterium]
MKDILIATKNQGKIEEYKAIFKELEIPLNIVSLKDLNVSADFEEDGKTFEENAVKKAEFYHNLTKLPVLSDDSGIEIDYLGGEPGIKSRRWPGYEATDEELINIALEKLKGVGIEKRGAQLRAVVGLIIPEESKIYTFEGILRGHISEKPLEKRMNGYPFRSIFIPENNKKYLGELSVVAHRKQAIEKALPLIKKIQFI